MRDFIANNAKTLEQKQEKIYPKFVGLQSVFWITIYMAWYHIKRRKFPLYNHHRPVNIYKDMVRWIMNYLYRPCRKFKHRKVLRELRQYKNNGQEIYFCPLQVWFDSQIYYSNYDNMENLISKVIHNFANYANKDAIIVFKHHPLDRAYCNYSRFIKNQAIKNNITDRVRYVDDVHLPKYLKLSDGVITMNSTVGMSALYHEKPLIALGTAIYDIQGLTYQGGLKDFWQNKQPPCQELFTTFKNYITIKTQLIGNFYHRGLSKKLAGDSLVHIQRLIHDFQ